MTEHWKQGCVIPPGRRYCLAHNSLPCHHKAMRSILDLPKDKAKAVRYVLMDIDDTLTREGKLVARAYQALWDLNAAGLRVIPVTGRPAGWCDCIARQWPVGGVIGENGALAFWEEADGRGTAGGDKRLPVLKQEFHPASVRNDHPVLEKIRVRTLTEISGLRVAKDQFARLFDLALDFAEEEPVLSLDEALRVKAIAEREGANAKVSSIHVNVWMGDYDKLSMAERFLALHYGWKPDSELGQVLFVGDSPNDEPMFARFPLACGVANIHKYQHLMVRLPAYVAEEDCGEGFAQIVRVLLEIRRKDA